MTPNNQAESKPELTFKEVTVAQAMGIGESPQPEYRLTNMAELMGAKEPDQPDYLAMLVNGERMLVDASNPIVKAMLQYQNPRYGEDDPQIWDPRTPMGSCGRNTKYVGGRMLPGSALETQLPSGPPGLEQALVAEFQGVGHNGPIQL